MGMHSRLTDSAFARYGEENQPVSLHFDLMIGPTHRKSNFSGKLDLIFPSACLTKGKTFMSLLALSELIRVDTFVNHPTRKFHGNRLPEERRSLDDRKNAKSSKIYESRSSTATPTSSGKSNFPQPMLQNMEMGSTAKSALTTTTITITLYRTTSTNNKSGPKDTGLWPHNLCLRIMPNIGKMKVRTSSGTPIAVVHQNLIMAKVVI